MPIIESSYVLEQKESFFRKIKGTEVAIPDLHDLLPGWRFETNRNYGIVKYKTDKWVESWLKNEPLLHKMKIANFGKLAACIFPNVPEEECLVMAYYHLWIFLWDDELDCGPYTDDPKKAMQFKKETEMALEYTLGAHPFTGHPPPMTPIMTAFAEVAEKVVPGLSVEARRRLLSELRFYVEAACLLPLHRNTSKKDLFSVEGFLEQRKASGGVGPTLILAQYAHHIKIPAFILDHESMRTIWDQSCFLGHLINDIASFAKELADNQLDNIVPLLAIEKKVTLQEAVEMACDLVRDGHRTFENAEKRVPRTGNADLDKQITVYIQACKDLVTGVLQWYCQNERYFGKNPKREGNKIFLQILP